MDINFFSVAVRKGSVWYIGKVVNGVFIKSKKIKKLSDVKNASDYVALKKYLNERKSIKHNEAEILKELGVDSIYIMNLSPEEEEWSIDWWDKMNDVCMKCTNDCKQSYKATVYRCEGFKSL